MWELLGFLVASAAGVAIALWGTRRGAARLESEPWLLADTAKLHVTIMGGLAGFAVTGIVLIVGLVRSQPETAPISLNTVLVMFVVAYFYYVGNAFLISYLPSHETSGDFVPRVHFSLASTIEYRTMFVSWFAIMPLMQTQHLVVPAQVLSFLLPLSLLLGSVVLAMAADGLGLLHVNETYLTAGIGTTLALIYAGAVHWAAPSWQSEYSALVITMVLFCINGMGFAVAAATPLASRYPAMDAFYRRYGRRLVLIDMQLTMLVLGFLWLAVVGAI